MIEEQLTPEQITENEKTARRMLLEAVAIAALIEAGATQPTRVLPVMIQGLEAVHIGDGELRIFAVDSSGRVRYGPKGPMTAEDLAREIGKNEGFRELAWNPASRIHSTSGRKTGRSMITWQ
jgi:hypothetical protein